MVRKGTSRKASPAMKSELCRKSIQEGRDVHHVSTLRSGCDELRGIGSRPVTGLGPCVAFSRQLCNGCHEQREKKQGHERLHLFNSFLFRQGQI